MSRLAIRPQTSCGIVGEEQRPGLQAELLEAGQHDRRRRRGRQAERQQRHQRARRGGVVGGLRAGDALDGALAEFFRMLRKAPFGGVGEEGRNLGAAGRHGADREADRRAAQPGLPGAPPVLAASSMTEPLTGSIFSSRGRMRGSDRERLADGEERHRERRHLDAVEEIGHAEGAARACPVSWSMPISPSASPMNSAVRPAQRANRRRRAETVMKASTISAKYSAGPNDSANLDHRGAMKRQPQRRDQCRPRRSRWRRWRAPAAPPLAGHLVAFEGGDDRGAFARRVEQDRGGRAAIHAAVVDAGEHDQRPAGSSL